MIVQNTPDTQPCAFWPFQPSPGVGICHPVLHPVPWPCGANAEPSTAVKEIHKRCVFWSATVIVSPIDINTPRTLYRCQAKFTHLIGVEGTRGLTDLNAIVLWSRVTVCQCAFCDSSTARRPHRTVAMIQAQTRLDHQISTERSSTKHRRVNRIPTWENVLRKAVRFREWAY